MTDFKHIFGELHYQIIRKISDGGMGIVFEAFQGGADQFKKQVAIKIIKEEYSQIEEFRKNFVGEAKLVADLIHSNIVQIYYLGKFNEQYYMTMEYVNGLTLENFIKHHSQAQQKIPLEIVVFIISRLCRGLSYAHQKCDPQGFPLGIVHRDINPRNVLISYSGEVKLTDFGIAKALDLMCNNENEVIAGKDGYLSPEQARKEATDGRSDLYAVGIILAEMVIGYNPFIGFDSEETTEKILRNELPDFKKIRPEIDDCLLNIMERSLAHKKKDRYQSSSEILNAMELYLYRDGYGPTNEKLANYLLNIFENQKSEISQKLEFQKQLEFSLTIK